MVGVDCQHSGWPPVGLSGGGAEGYGKSSFLSGQLSVGRTTTYVCSEGLQEHWAAVGEITRWSCSPAASPSVAWVCEVCAGGSQEQFSSTSVYLLPIVSPF